VAKFASGAFTPDETIRVKITNPAYSQAEGRAASFSRQLSVAVYAPPDGPFAVYRSSGDSTGILADGAFGSGIKNYLVVLP
jgi:hypothetical protein